YDCTPASDEPLSLGVEVVTTEARRPMLVTHAPDDASRLFIVEENGRIILYKGGELLSEPFLDIQDQVSRTSSDIGLLGLAFHPDYQENGLFYVHYSAEPGVFSMENGDTIVSEFKVSADPDLADPHSERLVLAHYQPAEHHNGGSLQFSSDRFLYLGLGDGSNGGDAFQQAQDTGTILGAIARLDVDDTTDQDWGNYGI